MANTCYDNFFLSNEIEDQYQSHLDLQQFCTVDNNLTGVAGMVRKIHKYKATDGTEKLTMGNGNTKTIEAGYTEKEYRIQMAQNRFQYYDEEAMTDPMVITTGTRHAGTDMFNTVNADIFGAFNEATMTIVTTALGFDAFVDGAAMLNLENLEGVTIFGFVNPLIWRNFVRPEGRSEVCGSIRQAGLCWHRGRYQHLHQEERRNRQGGHCHQGSCYPVQQEGYGSGTGA